jgi:hypothetical protein
MADENIVKLKVDGDVFEVEFNELTLDEVGTVEDLCGRSVQEIDWNSARGIQGLAWIAMHRKNPRFTVQDAGRVKFTSIEDPDEEPERPTGGGKARAKSGAATS